MSSLNDELLTILHIDTLLESTVDTCTLQVVDSTVLSLSNILNTLDSSSVVIEAHGQEIYDTS